METQTLVKFPIRFENEGECINYEYKPWINAYKLNGY